MVAVHRHHIGSPLLNVFFCHDTGHGKIETMGALTISGLLLATGGGIAWSAVDTLQAWASILYFSHQHTMESRAWEQCEKDLESERVINTFSAHVWA